MTPPALALRPGESIPRLQEEGYLITTPLVDATTLSALAPALAQHAEGVGRREAGSRNLLGEAWCSKLAQTLARHPAIAPLLGTDKHPVNCTYFDKTAQCNWLVSIHQDLSVPVATPPAPERPNPPGYQGWTRKDGRYFVQPPAKVLARTLAVRLHLDDCDADNGPVRVWPGSHRNGRLDPAAIQAWRETGTGLPCLVAQGAALIMRPLLLHASSRALRPAHRRVLHFLFGPEELPGGVCWEPSTGQAQGTHQ